MSQREFEEKIRSIQRFTHFQLWQISWVFWELFFSKFSAVHKKILMFFKMHSKGFRTNWVWVIVFLIIFKISLKANKSVTAAGQTDWQHRSLCWLWSCVHSTQAGELELVCLWLVQIIKMKTLNYSFCNLDGAQNQIFSLIWSRRGHIDLANLISGAILNKGWGCGGAP